MTMTLLIIFIVLALVIVSAILSARDKKKSSTDQPTDASQDAAAPIYSSQNLHQKLNEERRREGKTAVQAINNMGGANSGTMASQDRSWDNVADFFVKMGKGAGSSEVDDEK